MKGWPHSQHIMRRSVHLHVFIS